MWRHRYLPNKVYSVATTTFCCVSCRHVWKLVGLLLLKKRGRAVGPLRTTCENYDYRIIVTITDKALPPFRLYKSVLSPICVAMTKNIILLPMKYWQIFIIRFSDIPYVDLSLVIVRHFRKGTEKNTTRCLMPICFHGKITAPIAKSFVNILIARFYWEFTFN